MTILAAERVSRTYRIGDAVVRAVADVSLTLESGDFVALVGPSGCGKSTLLHLCGAMDRPTSGTITLEARVLGELSDEELTRVRRERVGFVFQFFNLLPTLTAVENVALPLLAERKSRHERLALARETLAMVGLADRAEHRPDELSGGEQQRVAIARALVLRPRLILADEPTGNLDGATGRQVVALLHSLVVEHGLALLAVTHSDAVVDACDRSLEIRDGRLRVPGE
jgi:putative ABC transport system ATP-binding protein